MSVRVQAWGIIAAVLADTDPSGAAVRQRLSNSLDENPGVPERALLEYLLETRRSDANTEETLESARQMRLAPNSMPPKFAEQLDAIRSVSRISALLENQMLMTAFQPIYGLADKSVVGVEALSRFVSDDGAAAELWFAEAAAVGLGANLEFSALGSAAAAARDLPADLYVSLNISPTSCLDPRLPELFAHIDLPIDRVVLELTETIPDEEYAQFIAAINPLRDKGLRIAIDDTHSGAGALSRMVHLRPDFLKVGRDVFGNVDNDGLQRALTTCLVDFTDQIGTTLVAEGIETVGELKVLTELGIDAGQGYLLGRPSVRPQDWASWNTRQDADGLNRQLAEPAGRSPQENESA
ncbi:EAL domain, c-di-GMP-specific phosphodiesterase class I (or its enzymatically inactive variant) [Pseudarthrobacter equi]|uniref:EAL domain, c-di-GMP-specific phosphodiesterase class I (Or its enzymatically inactive variant) n=1 Tax=Pseudarthrobacter equi TaxID=728066 RepID=A0A1H1TUS3_9MICC|nr:EAL domain-containing protein [Pseudarthrobacter equi]SDS63948.1 EAL domain, c-di-GMP-specific phosphodiesterase class I (or its enzymatically inactive variant) [Pseudarthrobacter equi]